MRKKKIPHQPNIAFDITESEILKFFVSEHTLKGLKELQHKNHIEITQDTLLEAMRDDASDVEDAEIHEACEVLSEIDVKEAFKHLVLMPYIERYSVWHKDEYEGLRFGE